MAKLRKKPTIMEVANVVIEQGRILNEHASILRSLDNIIGLYIRKNGDLDEFNKYVEKEMEKKKEELESEQKENERPNEEDILTDSKDEGSGSEGIRKKDK